MDIKFQVKNYQLKRIIRRKNYEKNTILGRHIIHNIIANAFNNFQRHFK